MIYRVHIHPEAAAEFYGAIVWDESQQAGLGSRFENEVVSSLRLIADRPETGGFTLDEFRQFAVDGFPFVIVYKIAVATADIYVSSVFHTRRNPQGKFRE